MRILALTALLLLFASPAQAHDQLVDANPSEGETVEAGIIDIELRFSDDVLGIGQGNEILVIGPIGEQSELRNNSCASSDDDLVSTQVDLDTPGDYTISWRVVSGDGHPITGIQRFTVENTTGHQSNGLVPGTDCSSAIESLNDSETQPGLDTEWLWVLAIFPIVGLGIYLALRPKKQVD